MNILVCVKQVPNTKHMTIDSESNRLVRHGIAAILNPADRYALEKALRFRDQHGGKITVISMGAVPAESELVAAHLVGADRCLLLTDPVFGGSDSFATASVLAAAARYEEKRMGGPFDIIYCGKSTIDGETGQVGPELAEILGIPYFSNISRMDYTAGSCRIEYSLDEKTMLVDAQFPVLLTYPFGGDVCLRAAISERLSAVEEVKIPRLSFEDLQPWLNKDEIGLNGSATRVVRSFVPPTQRQSVRIDQGTAKEKAALLMEHLIKDGWVNKKKADKPAVITEEIPEKSDRRICVFVEQDEKNACKNISLELLTPAIEMGIAAKFRVSAILVGVDNRKAEEELSHYPIEEIISCEDAELADMQVPSYMEAVAGIIETYQPEGLLVGSTEFGKELAARIAARFHTGLTAECTGVRYEEESESIIWSRPAYGGKLMADIICRKKRPQMGTIREGVFEKVAFGVGNPKIIRMNSCKSRLADKVKVLKKTVLPGFVPQESNDISMIVSMGRGVRNVDGCDLCCDFADAIGASLGASRGAVEQRLLPQQYLIGVNGKTVRPSIYFACGISGSMQHMTGVLDSGCIVAINTNPKAEIFQYADYCVVGDLFEILPELQEEFEQLR